ncbi:lipopolysaccharide biosynthesis protein [Sphingopyxis sp. KK2]|uniref:lipopolysaccharide biosynthesis protein n=1 Tax=Sphingopyxis sp. KK2 TaxID=1855727 RepID=UPI00097E73C5|nr:lipopolysaccharide biosynthesis protein [Sphingopyxis sp. KK2]
MLSGSFLFASQIIIAIGNFFLFLITARLLSPEQFGVFAMAMPVISFMSIFRDLGLSQALVQADSLSPEELRGSFSFFLLCSVVTSAMLLLLGVGAGYFYGDLRPTLLICASAIPSFLVGISLQSSAIANRNRMFADMAFASLLAFGAQFASTVAAALVLESYWALWIGFAMNSVVQSGYFLIKLRSIYRPTLNLSPARHLIWYSSRVFASNFMNFFIRSFDNILIGRVWGPFQLGLYDRSYRLMMIPMELLNAPLAKIMVPVLRDLKSDQEAFRATYTGAIGAVTVLIAPGMAVAGLLSHIAVTLILGAKWEAAADIFFWLSLVGIFQAISNSTGWLFMLAGRVQELMKWTAFSVVFTVVAFFIGVNWGAKGVAISFFASASLRMPVLFAYCTRGTAVLRRDLWEIFLMSWAYFVVAFGVTSILPFWMDGIGLLLLSFAIAYSICLALFLLTPTGRWALNYVMINIFRRDRT